MAETGLVPFNPFQMMDRLDDKAIVDEIEGRISDSWVYHFKPGGGAPEVWGIGKEGTDQAVMELSKQGHVIREGEVDFKQCPIDPEYVIFIAKASLFAISREGVEIRLQEKSGTKRQWTKMQLRNKTIIEDPFWLEKGATKATRNAQQRLIPAEIKAKIIALAKKLGKVKEVKDESPQAQTEKTQSATTDKLQKEDRIGLITAALKIKKMNEGLFRKWYVAEYGIVLEEQPVDELESMMGLIEGDWPAVEAKVKAFEKKKPAESEQQELIKE